MVISRQLRIALLISFLWHLFCMSFVSIVFLPGAFKPRHYSSVYFLGSILGSPVSARPPALLESGRAGLPVDKRGAGEARRMPRLYKGDFVKLPPELDARMDITPFSERQRTSLPAQRKVLNPDDFIDVDVLLRQGFPLRSSSFGGQVEGLSPEAQALGDVSKEDISSFESFASAKRPKAQRDSSLLQNRPSPSRDSSLLQNRPSPSRSGGRSGGRSEGRQIIFQPAFLNYPEVAIQQELKGDWAIFKIYISADGLVEQLICIQVSGNPEIDAALARYIERWRFAPVAGLQGQWQTVKISLDAK